MKRASYLNWSLVRRYLTLSCALVALEGASTGKDAGSEVKQDAKEAVKLVDGIANRNKPPELKARFPQRIGLSVPVFPKCYDWQEDERVIESLKKLWANPSIELWEELVRMDGKDARYCITVKTPGDNAKILTVGKICASLAYDGLLDVYRRALPANPKNECARIYLDSGITDKGLAEWRKERKNKSLYELQIEVCEHALRSLVMDKELKDLSETQRNLIRQKIEGQIVKLKRTKAPIWFEHNWFEEGYELYHPRERKKK